jgi:transglutaminase-like putative cysteine protease
MSENPADTLALMQQIVDRYAFDDYVRQSALRILRKGDVRKPEGIVRALAGFVRDRMRYVKDPVNAEHLTTPDRLLADIWGKGWAYGDCDDHVVLLATLLTSVGVNNHALAVKLNADYFNHVINAAFVGGRWIDIDTCYKDRIPPDYRDRMVLRQG